MQSSPEIPVKIIKKKSSHGGHHGGAWKVAYADFVTAMMALFIVLWIVGQSKTVRDAVAAYFKDPSGIQQQGAPSILKGGAGSISPQTLPPPGARDGSGGKEREGHSRGHGRRPQREDPQPGQPLQAGGQGPDRHGG
jgi:flagellar motor protein MotB